MTTSPCLCTFLSTPLVWPSSSRSVVDTAGGLLGALERATAARRAAAVQRRAAARARRRDPADPQPVVDPRHKLIAVSPGVWRAECLHCGAVAFYPEPSRGRPKARKTTQAAVAEAAAAGQDTLFPVDDLVPRSAGEAPSS